MNYYELLGVKQSASEDEIKEAYKKLMKKWHPDINKDKDAVNMSSKINEAKEVLLDSEKRKNYDIYLTEKTKEDYNKYTQRKARESNTNSDTNVNKNVTKWEYLNDWLKYANYSSLRKVLAVIGVMLETFLCFLIKILIIGFSFICNIISYFIQMSFIYVYPIIGIIFLLFIAQCISQGFNKVITDSPEAFTAVISITLIYISSFILPILSKLILSPKVFDILYNKIDIGLFKKCIGYKN